MSTNRILDDEQVPKFTTAPVFFATTCLENVARKVRQAGNLVPSDRRTGQAGRRQAGNAGAGRQQKGERAVFKSKTTILASEKHIRSGRQRRERHFPAYQRRTDRYLGAFYAARSRQAAKKNEHSEQNR